jgi:lipoprotein NlpD
MRIAIVILLSLCLLACAGEPRRAPVEDRHGESQLVKSRKVTKHTVTSGDTLYAIAWSYGLDYRILAAANGISVPYVIFPGQVLSLEPRQAAKPTAARKPAASVTKPRTSVNRVPAKSTTPPVKPATRTDPALDNAVVSGWRWPTSGKVVRKYSGTVHKGIDIDGQAGDSVVAVAPGRVVYAGSGIVGYGNLLIVKHNEVYLSAYGHNRSLLVKEGERVAAGQQIAEKGSSATNTVKLHFEIRREGKPIDPKKLLPSR